MAETVKRLVLSGYYGFKNSGDEAVLQSILHALKSEGEQAGVRFEPVVLSADPAWTETTYGVKAVHRMKLREVWKAIRQSDGLISGGGSLLQDATGSTTIPYYLGIVKMAQWAGKPAFIYSQGIGPVNRRRFYPWIRSVFSKCAYVSVRDRESAELLAHMGFNGPAEVVPDPVMGLQIRGGERQERSTRGSVIGVSVRFWNADRSELDALAESLSIVVKESDAEIRFLPFHLPADEDASRYVLERIKAADPARVGMVSGVTHPQDMLAEVDACDLLIGMRLHSLIYAASRYVPLIGISYDPKIDRFLHRLDMQAAAATGRFDARAVAAEALRLLQSGSRWAEEKRSAVEGLKAEAQKPASKIAEYFLNHER